MRKLKIFFITLICLLASNVAYTLGVGSIEVKSGLSEPLNAEIQLFSVRPGEGDNIRVTMATLKEFTAAGIDRPLHLSFLKFKVIEKSDGNAYIRVYSERPIREPFLDFLVDIDWPSGRLLREYTLLLDPPIFAQTKAAPLQTPVVTAPTQIIREEKRAPAPVVTASHEDELFPHIEIDTTPTQALDRTPRVVAPVYKSDTYKVKRSQTLWSIAEAIRPNDSIGVSQMMLALQKANPNAFSNNNINGLKAGSVLRIPDLADVKVIGRTEAVAKAKQQNLAWRDAQTALATAVTPSGTVKTTDAAANDKSVTSAQAAESTVKLITPDSVSTGTQGVGTDDTASSEKLALANEQVASKAKENTELQNRVKSLEDQIGSMERLLELKDDSLSELQTKLGDAEPVPEIPPVAEKQLGEPIVEKEVESVEEQVGSVVEEQAELVEEKEPVESIVKSVVPDSSKINPYALDSKPKAKQPAAEFSLSSLLDDPSILAAMLAVLLAIIVVAWLVIKRRQNNVQFPESILSSKQAISTTTTAANTETSLLSDFAPSSMDGALESDSSEVDPSAEADVYIAYGKHQQAEELLLTSIEQEPDRLDLRLKLMEVYYATGNADSFLTHATKLNNSMDDQNTALWDKAVVMGRELCPGNELFGVGELGAEDDFSDLDGISDDMDDDLDLTLDMGEVASEVDSNSEELSIDGDEELSLDMELDSSTDDDLTLEIDELSLEEIDEASDSVTTDEADSDSDLAIDFGEMDESEATAVEDDAMLGMDEVATKLDLAKAYIDMGDPDGARAILDEVLTEGNDDQQSEAKGLIEQL